jgi:outer membrane protein assembly factor BamB
MYNLRSILSCVVLLIGFTACNEHHTLLVHKGGGSGEYRANSKVFIEADTIHGDSVFVRWTGGEGYVRNVYKAGTVIDMPDKGLKVYSLYRYQNSTGIADLDVVRQEVKTIPTNQLNIEGRRAALFRFQRFLWRQAVDMKSFDKLANRLLNDGMPEKDAAKTIDLGFQHLDELWLNGAKVVEIKGEPAKERISKTNWSRAFGTEGSHRGYSPDPGPSEGQIDWQFAKGYISIASPVVEDGKIYLSSPGIDVMGYCLDEKTGEVLWTARQNGTWFYGVHSCRQTPVLTNNSVFLRTGGEETPKLVFDKSNGQPQTKGKSGLQFTAHTEKGKSVQLFDANTGDVLWTVKVDEFIADQPTTDSLITFFNTIDGKVNALSTGNGEAVWTKQLKQVIHSRPTLTSTGLYVGTESRHLIKLNPENGEELWSYKADEIENKAYQYYSTPIEKDGVVYVGTASKYLYALDAVNGRLLWEKELSDWVRAAPLVLNDIIYVACLDGQLHGIQLSGEHDVVFSQQINEHGFTADLSGNDNGILATGRDLILYSVSPVTGNLLWKHGVLNGSWVDDRFYAAGWSGGLLGSPTVVDDIVYIGGPDGFMNALDADTGEEKWRFETNSTTSLAPTVAEGKVFFGYLGSFTEHYGYAKPGEYFAVDKNSGEPVWTSTEYGKVWVSAAYNKGNIFIGNVDGTFYGVNAANGKKLWEYYTGKNTIKETMPKDTPFMHGYPPGVYCCPAIDDNQVYSGSWSGYYFAFDQQTGKLNWRTKTQANDFGGLPDSSAPSFYKGNLYVQKKGGMIAALDRKTGKLQWEIIPRMGYLQNATITAHNNKIFGSAVRQVVRLPFEASMMAFEDVENGSKKLWQQRGLGGLTPAVVNDEYLFAGSSADMFITCLDQTNGQIKWRVFTGGEMLENGPAIYGNHIYALCKNGYLIAIK